MNQTKNILILCPYPPDTAAGQRLKYEQYLSMWQAAGYNVTIRPFMSAKLWAIVYKQGYVVTKIIETLKGYIGRIKDMFTISKYDAVYVFMYVTPIGFAGFEKWVRRHTPVLILDLEDNRFLGANAKGFAQIIRGVSKTKYLVTNSNHVITSSPYLNDVCLQMNRFKQCTYISSSVNMDRYQPATNKSSSHLVTIGWTGTFSSRQYLDLLIPVFKKLAGLIDYQLLVIGDFNDYKIDGVNVKSIYWNKDTEMVDLQKMDIGVYPLTIDEWVMGKSGLKAIQYMAIGIPCVASDISTVQQFMVNGHNGMRVNTEQEWLEALLHLIKNPDLRKKMGENARETVVANFSTDVIGKTYLHVLNTTLK